jgi:hypothetical protein
MHLHFQEGTEFHMVRTQGKPPTAHWQAAAFVLEQLNIQHFCSQEWQARIPISSLYPSRQHTTVLARNTRMYR